MNVVAICSFCAFTKQKLILLSHRKLVDYHWMLDETDWQFIVCFIVATLLFFLRSELFFFCFSNVTRTAKQWCQQRQWRWRRQQTILSFILQLIIAIISINSILAQHLAWFILRTCFYSFTFAALVFRSHLTSHECQRDAVLNIVFWFHWIFICFSLFSLSLLLQLSQSNASMRFWTQS